MNLPTSSTRSPLDMSGSSGAWVSSVKDKVVNRLVARQKTVSKSVVSDQTQNLGDPKPMFQRYFEPLIDGKPVPPTFIESITKAWQFKKHYFEEKDQIMQKEKLKKDFDTYRQDIKKDGIPVKLYINALENKSQNNMKRLGARLLTTYGLVHCGIQLGPYILDWNTTELIEPRPLKSNQKILAVLDLKHNIPADEKSLLQVCHLISNWNRKFHYDNLGRSMKKATKTCKANCHCFTKAFTKEFAIKKYWKPNGIIARYLKKVKQLDYDVKRKFRATEFKSHQELDDFYQKRYVEGGRKLDVESYELLKSFDRGFWINGDRADNCPFINDLATVAPKSDEINPFNITRSLVL